MNKYFRIAVLLFIAIGTLVTSSMYRRRIAFLEEQIRDLRKPCRCVDESAAESYEQLVGSNP